MRTSRDEIRDGYVFSGFDYRLQVWVRAGVIQSCGHPESMRPGGKPCCPAYRLAGQRVRDVEGAERREQDTL
jgi:hypothetical protein